MTLFSRLFANFNYYYRLLLGRLFGISYIVSYLRNPDPLISVRLLRSFGANIGEATTIKRSVFFDNVYEDANSAVDFSHFQIGSNCYIGDCVYMDLADEISIKNNVVISGRVSFITHSDCNRSKELSRLFPAKRERIIVEDGCWIAFGATILNGVSIGKRTVIAANSLVNKNANDFCLYGGTPAVKIRSLKGNQVG